MEHLAEALRPIAATIAIGVEVLGVAVVLTGVLHALYRYGLSIVRPEREFPPGSLRISLGRSLGLGLEFLLAADIILTAISPTWEEIGRLAAIATIRTLLTYFLQREIREDLAETRTRAELKRDGINADD